MRSPCGATMDSQDEPEAEKLLLLGDDEKSLGDGERTPTQAPTHPFKKWMDSFRARKRVPATIPERYVEGWSFSQPDLYAQNQPPPSEPPRDQHWEKSSEHSSQLGTVKTISASITSQSMVRSRGTTQSTTTQSAVTDLRISGDSSRPTSSNYVDEAAELRASRRRQVLRELVSTEADYVLGLKALTGVRRTTEMIGYHAKP